MRVITLERPGKYLDDETMRQVSRDVLGHDPYQVAVFHLVAERPFATTGDQEMSLDVVMVRPSADSGWLVHDKGGSIPVMTVDCLCERGGQGATVSGLGA